ncbi:unnamed protein product, partial [Prunus brigantina]
TFCQKLNWCGNIDQGDLQLLKPISLCFLEGPEAGIGILLGKNPEKWPECWYFGLSLKTWAVLEAWQLPRLVKMNVKKRHTSRITGRLLEAMLACWK